MEADEISPLVGYPERGCVFTKKPNTNPRPEHQFCPGHQWRRRKILGNMSIMEPDLSCRKHSCDSCFNRLFYGYSAVHKLGDWRLIIHPVLQPLFYRRTRFEAEEELRANPGSGESEGTVHHQPTIPSQTSRDSGFDKENFETSVFDRGYASKFMQLLSKDFLFHGTILTELYVWDRLTASQRCCWVGCRQFSARLAESGWISAHARCLIPPWVFSSSVQKAAHNL